MNRTSQDFQTPDQPEELTTLARGAGVVFLGTVLGTGLKYLFELSVSRTLGAETFGLIFLGFTIFKISERLSTLGLPNGVLRFVSLYHGVKDYSRVKGTILASLKLVFLVSFAFMLLLVFSAQPASRIIFKKPPLSPLLIVFGVCLIFTALTEILVFSTQAFQIMEYKVLVRWIIEPGSRLVMVLLLLFLGLKLTGVMISFSFSFLVGFLLALFFLKKIFPDFYRPRLTPKTEYKRLLVFSWPLFFVGFLNLFIIQINTLMLGHFRPSEEVGVFGAAQRTAFLIPIILESFNAIFAPIIADYYHRRQLGRLENLFKIVTKWVVTFSLPLFLVVFLLADKIISLWGKDFSEGALCLMIIAISQLVNFSVGPVGYMVMMSGRSYLNLFNTIVVLLTTISLNLWLIPSLGILGAAISVALAVMLRNILRLAEVLVILRMHPFRRDFLKPLAAGVVMLGIIEALKRTMLASWPTLIFILVVGFVAVAFYVVCLVVFKFTSEDKFIIEKILLRMARWKNNKGAKK